MRTILILCLLAALPQLMFGALSAPATPVDLFAQEVPASSSKASTPVLNREALEAKLGRKLKFKERIVYGILKRKVKRQQKRQARGGPVDGLALGSFIAGLLTLVLLLVSSPVSLLTGLVALILGIVGLGRFRRNPEFRTGKGYAIAGIAIGGGLIFFFLLVLAIFIGTFG